MVILDLFVIVIVVAIIGGAVYGVSQWLTAKRGLSRHQASALTRENIVAIAALNRIVAGAGAPILEAQDALDEINSIKIKELS